MMTLAFLPGGMPGIGEIGIIALILVLLFGARKLPELARALGSSLTEFKKGRREGERPDAEATSQESGKQPSAKNVNRDERETGKETPYAEA